MTKIRQRSKVMPVVKNWREELDSVKALRSGDQMLELVWQCRRAWDGLRQFRENADRAKRYCNGDQWSDMVKYDGDWMTEAEMLQKTGNIPLKNNLIGKNVRTITSLYRKQGIEPLVSANDPNERGLSKMLGVALQVNWKNNQEKEVIAKAVREYLLSGLICFKEAWTRHGKAKDSYTFNVDSRRLFFNVDMSDVRAWDLRLIGEIHDMSKQEVIKLFGQTAEGVSRLKELYSQRFNPIAAETTQEQEEYHKLGNLDFAIPIDSEKWRVIEVWTLETKGRYEVHDEADGQLYIYEESEKELIDIENQARMAEAVAQGIDPDDVALLQPKWFIDEYWYCRIMTTWGDVIDEYESPYEHGEHPYVLRAYPFDYGNIRSYVSDFIDQQRYVNRMITLNDKVIRNAAKGVLLFPLSKAGGLSREEIEKQWKSPEGVMIFDDTDPRSTALPHQVTQNPTNVGAREMLQLQIELMQEISGVNGAMQGKAGFAGQAASMYAQQAANATTAVYELMEVMSTTVMELAKKKLKNIQQFYDRKRHLKVSGKDTEVVYDPEIAGGVDADVTVTEGIETPVLRAMDKDVLLQLYKDQAIGVKKLLEFGDWEWAPELLESIKADEQAMANGQAPQGVSPEMMEQIKAGADQEAVAQARQALGMEDR